MPRRPDRDALERDHVHRPPVDLDGVGDVVVGRSGARDGRRVQGRREAREHDQREERDEGEADPVATQAPARVHEPATGAAGYSGSRSMMNSSAPCAPAVPRCTRAPGSENASPATSCRDSVPSSNS